MSTLRAAIRRLATLPGFRRLTAAAPLLRLSFALRASLVHESLRFAANELRRGDVTASYRLRDSPVRITIRHHSPDVLVLDEIFSQREYEFPPPVEQRLKRNALRVADLGANIGLFGAWVLGRFPEAQILAFEPDPANAALHARTIEENRRGRSWKLVEACAAPASGTVRLAAGAYATSRLAVGGEQAIDVPAVDVFPYLREVDFLKIDIEGGEWAILSDPRFADVAADAIVLEYHADLCPSEDAEAFAEEALRRGGFEVVRGQGKPTFGAGILWGWRPSDPAAAS